MGCLSLFLTASESSLPTPSTFKLNIFNYPLYGPCVIWDGWSLLDCIVHRQKTVNVYLPNHSRCQDLWFSCFVQLPPFLGQLVCYNEALEAPLVSPDSDQCISPFHVPSQPLVPHLHLYVCFESDGFLQSSISIHTVYPPLTWCYHMAFLQCLSDTCNSPRRLLLLFFAL